jgi:glyoxylase-like metal-dependent hydrolase (beta-lactamase superfamily II)
MVHEVQLSLHGEAAAYLGGVHEIADGCLAYLQPNGGVGESNVGLIVDGGQSLVIDTCWDHDQAQRMLGAAAPWLVDNPITTVVNTHSNGDHWWGNAVMPADATIVTSAAARETMDREPRWAMATGLAAVAWALKLPLPQSVRAPMAAMHADFSPFNFRGVRLRYPDRVFTGSLQLSVGSHAVELVEVGPAHTSGDLLVFDRTADVAFAGDVLFVGKTPVMWEGPAQNWVQALQRILDAKPSATVPGHGPLASIADVTAMQEYFDWLGSRAAQLCGDGISPLDAAVRMLSSDTFATSVWAAWDNPHFILPAIEATYRHTRGRRLRFPTLNTLTAFSRINALAKHLAKMGVIFDAGDTPTALTHGREQSR